jgi:hypothetical protein
MRSATAGDAENDKTKPQTIKKITDDNNILSIVHHQWERMFLLD